jgi:hypothetical protein
VGFKATIFSSMYFLKTLYPTTYNAGIVVINATVVGLARGNFLNNNSS